MEDWSIKFGKSIKAQPKDIQQIDCLLTLNGGGDGLADTVFELMMRAYRGDQLPLAIEVLSKELDIDTKKALQRWFDWKANIKI